MSHAPDESSRLETLRLYRILDTAAERAFDELAELAAAICEAPISLISLVDDQRQWFKARVGLEVEETPRCIAFFSRACADALIWQTRADPTPSRVAEL